MNQMGKTYCIEVEQFKATVHEVPPPPEGSETPHMRSRPEIEKRLRWLQQYERVPVKLRDQEVEVRAQITELQWVLSLSPPEKLE
jgi:hypothetical protein